MSGRFGGIVWIGEPGSGKGSLLSTIAGELRDAGRRVVPFSGASDDVLESRSAGPESDRPSPIREDDDRAPDVRADAVVLVGDLDLVDPLDRDRILAAARAAGGVVVLGIARHAPPIPRDGRMILVRSMPALTPIDTLRYLQAEHGIGVAPIVASTVCTALGGNPGAIRDVARLLSREQLLGRSALPDPLPLSPLIAAVLADDLATLDDAERRTLLIAGVAVVDRVDVLCSAAEIERDELIHGRLARYISLLAGRFGILDQRVRCAVHELASLGERTDAHVRLAQAHESLGEIDVAAWHSSLAHHAGNPQTIVRLMSLARRSRRRGNSVWAHAVARQAAAQADARERRPAEYLAGLTALESGFTTDALDWLSRSIRSAHPFEVARAGAAFVVAATLAHGEVPDADIRRLVAVGEATPDDRDGVAVRDTVSAVAVAAALLAERGAARSSDGLLRTCRSLVSRDARATALLEAADRWCSAFGTAPPDAEAEADGHPGAVPAELEPYAVVARALELARRREWTAAAAVIGGALLSMVAAQRSTGLLGPDDHAATPLAEAHLRVAGAMIDIAAGRLSKALDDLELAATTLPIGLPFAGLGVAALNRLSIIVDGTPHALYPALVLAGGRSVDAVVQWESLVDDSLMASVDGDDETAAVLMRLANEHLADRPFRAMVLPTPDEAQLWLAAGERGNAERCLAVPDADRGRSDVPAIWRGRLALATVDEIDALTAEISPLTARIASRYERARTELELSAALARAGDARARLHRLAAERFFASAGVTHPSGPGLLRSRTAPSPTVSAGSATDPAIRRTDQVVTGGIFEHWLAELTEREAEVARGVVEGHSNRAVARDLHLSVRTVETHLGRIFTKLGVHSRTQLAHVAHQSRRSSGVIT